MDAPKAVADTAGQAVAEACRGQKPKIIEPETYDAWPQSARDYLQANLDQWKKCGG